MKREVAGWLREAAIAAGLIGLGIGLRFILDPFLSSRQPLVTLYGALALVVFFVRLPVAIAAALGGYLVGKLLFIEPVHSLRITDPADAIGAVAYAVSAGLIITMGELLRRARDAADRNAAEVERRNAELHRFLAVLSHELRGPIAAVKNALVLLASPHNPEPERGMRALGIAQRQAGYLTRLVDDLLDVARVHNNVVVLRPEVVDVADVVAHAIEASGATLEAGRHPVELRRPPGPVCVEADFVRLSQVLSNLIVNAAKFSPPGAPIQVEVAPREREVELHVIDQGQGIPAERLPRIFEGFGAGESPSRHVAEGLGLGLRLVKSLTELHGGRVQAWSAGPGTGSRFTVVLPAAVVRDSAAAV